ncbi:MAG: spore protease YyaC [Lachnospiraceae bacterium]
MRERQVNYYGIGKAFSKEKFAREFAELICRQQGFANHPILCLGIGSDRITGDCLGPLIGYKLERVSHGLILVEGTLQRPVHAMNLEQKVEQIERMVPRPIVVAIDAAVGKEEHIGLITLAKGGLKPGLGVNKRLPQVGQISITGIVTSEAEKEPFYLQQISLSMVMEMADCICQGIVCGMRQIV